MLRLGLLILSFLLFACDRPATAPLAAPAPAPEAAAGVPRSPVPPVFESFDGQPQLSLFPRIGDFRPEDDDSEALPFWRTYIDHLTRISGLVQMPAPLGRGNAWAIRSLGQLESVAFFSPLEVAPETAYRFSALLKTDLPPGASAGIGVLEFDTFLWVGEQYPRSLAEKHQTGAREGARLEGNNDWRPIAFDFTTGPRTRMVHLIFFREGEESREPVLIDDVRFE